MYGVEMAGQRAADALVRRGRADRIDEALARGADQERQTERRESGGVRQADDALLRRLAEADAGVEHDVLAGDAGFRGNGDRAREEGFDVGDNVDARVGFVAVVHDNDGNAAGGHNFRHAGVALQAPDVVGDGCAVVERPGRDLGFERGDRHRQTEFDDGRQHRLQALEFVVSRYRPHAAIRPRRFRADIEHVGALRRHFLGMSDGALRIEELAAVGEGIRSDVEDAHDQRTTAPKQRRERLRRGGRRELRGRCGGADGLHRLWHGAPGRSLSRRRGAVRPVAQR